MQKVRKKGGVFRLGYGVLSLLLGVLLLASPVSGQDSPDLSFTADLAGQPLSQAIRQLEQVHGLQFSYLATALAGKTVNCRFEAASWPEVCRCLFQQNGLEVVLLEAGHYALRSDQSLTEWRIRLRTVNPEGTALPFVSVGLASRGISLVTDADGQLDAALRAAATDSLELHYLGYAVRRVSPATLSGPNHLEVVLQPASIELASVTVTEYLTDGISATEDGRRVIIDPGQVTALPGFADREVMRNLSLLPGINNLNETAGEISIRGGTPDQNLVLWDGIPVYASGHYFGMISNFSPELVDAVDVWRGQADAEYGGRVSGVIRMRTDEEIAPRLAGGGGLSLLQTDAWLQAPIMEGKSDLQLALRASLPALLDGPTYAGYREQALQGSLIGETLSGPDPTRTASENFRFREVNGRWLLRPSERQYLRLSGFYQDDELDYSLGQANEPGYFADALDSHNSGFSLHYGYRLGSGQELSLEATRTDFANLGENRYVNQLGATNVLRRSGIRETSASGRYRRQLPRSGSVKGGLQWQQYGYDFSLSTETDRGRLREANVRNGIASVVSAFGSYTWSPAGPFQLEAGLRLPWYTPTNKLYLEPRLNGSFRINDDWLLKAGYGANHQFPVQILELNEQRISASAPLWTLADGVNFQVQAGREASIGVVGELGTLLLDLELYHKRVTGLTSTELTAETTGFPTGDSRASGLDLLLKKRWGGFRSWVIYSLSTTEWFFPTVAPDYFPADNDRRHQLRLMQSYEHKRWSFSLGWRLHSGNRYTDFRLGRIRATDRGLRANLIAGPTNGSALPNFHRLDLAVNYDWSSPKTDGYAGQLTFSLLNVYDQLNILDRGFETGFQQDPPPGQRRFFREQIDRRGLGFTPNLAVRVGW